MKHIILLEYAQTLLCMGVLCCKEMCEDGICYKEMCKEGKVNC